MQPLIDYINNKKDTTAIELAFYHENLDQLAGAIGYYLEAVDLTTNPVIEYEGLLRAALCFEKQGGREGTTLNTLYKAISVLPERPEAVFHLLRILNKKSKFYESYALANSYLTRFSLPQNSLIKDCDYEGLHAIEFEKAIAAWYVGNFEEARTTIYRIGKSNYSNRYVSLANYNLEKINYPTMYTHSADKILKKPFLGSKTFNYSQAMQDMFVLTILDGKKEGTYLEIGSGDATIRNNTYLLEKEYGWTGVSIDINIYDTMSFGVKRKNSTITQDATKVNYYDVMSNIHVIDYLQVDCDPASLTYEVLEKIINSGKQFNVITFEHDVYRESETWRSKSRELLSKNYMLTVADVCIIPGKSFEDWWVHKSIFKPEMLGESFKTPDKYFY